MVWTIILEIIHFLYQEGTGNLKWALKWLGRGFSWRGQDHTAHRARTTKERVTQKSFQNSGGGVLLSALSVFIRPEKTLQQNLSKIHTKKAIDLTSPMNKYYSSGSAGYYHDQYITSVRASTLSQNKRYRKAAGKLALFEDKRIRYQGKFKRINWENGKQ